MHHITHYVDAILVPFLLAAGTLLLALVCHVLILHGVRDIVFHRRQRLVRRYRSIVEAALHRDVAADSVARLLAAPWHHRSVLAALILEPLSVAEGAVTQRGAEIAKGLGLIDGWKRQLRDRRWWIRAEAVRALGLVKHAAALPVLIVALDDPYDEVRAVAVEALGHIADPSAIPALVSRLSDQSRHQRVRLVQALERFGSAVAAPLVEHAKANPGEAAIIAELLGSVGAASALDVLIEWSSDARPDVRAAALHAIGTIGVDERAFYHVLRALSDDAEQPRAMAAWALGRSGRQEAAAYIAPRLQDGWIVAAHAARALRDLGAAGRRELESAAAHEDAVLARQMLWESSARARA
jgi:HEAT repeat protein